MIRAVITTITFMKPIQTKTTVLEICVSIKDNKRQEFLQMFELLSGTAFQINGRTDKRIYEEIKRPNHFLWTEEWNDADSRDNYFHSDRFRSLLGAIQVLGKLDRIRMGELSPVREIDDK